MENKNYKVQEVATAYGLNPMTLYRAICRGDLPAVKIGRSLRITEEGLHSFIKPVKPSPKGDAK